MRRVPHTRLLACVLLSLMVPGGLFAQTTGLLRGLVMDVRGSPLAGVSIIVVNSGLGVSGRGTVTDASGGFQVAWLPAAPDYFVRAAFPGFATVDFSEVEIKAGQATALRITLQPETAFRERVEGPARPQGVKLQNKTTQTPLRSEVNDAPPILCRRY